MEIGGRMSRLADVALISTDQRRVELARLLATGVIRVLLQQKTQDQSDSTETEPETSDDGLEDSRELPLCVSTRVNSRLSSQPFTKPRQE